MNRYYIILLIAFVQFFYGCQVNRNNQQKSHSGKSQFRIASYNIRYAAEQDEKSGNGWDIRKKHVANLIKSHQFDVVGTQEGNASQLQDMEKLLPEYDFVGHPYGGKKGDAHNNATFYKKELFTVLDSGVFWLSETPDTPSVGWDATDRRICHWTKFKDKRSGKEFFFFNAHFYWRLKTAKMESGALMVRKIQEIAGNSPVICVGDLNSEVHTPQMKAIKGLLSDAYDVSQTPPQGPEGTNLSGGVFQGSAKGRIDYLFVSKHFSVLDYKVLSDVYDNGRYPSDHLPVTSMVSFEVR